LRGKDRKHALRALLLDDDPSVRENAADEVEAMGWGADFTGELAAIAVQEISRRTPGGALLPALGALGKTKTDAAWRVLLRLARKGVKNPWRRGNLYLAIGRHARPRARPLLEDRVADAKEHRYVKQAAHFGLARLGERTALDALRADLDAKDVMIARAAAASLAELLGTKPAVTPPQLARLARWYDTHPAELQAFVRRGRRRK
jgi:HEAT repeat protein